MNLITGWIRRHGPVVLGIVISGALLSLALRDVHPGEVLRAISQARVIWLIPMAGVLAADLLIRALRWRILLPTPKAPAPPIKVWQLVQLEAIGLAVNNVVFLRIGEIARAYLAGQELRIPAITSLATIFVERALDMTALTLLFGMTALGYPDIVSPTLWKPALLISASMAAVLFALSRADNFLHLRIVDLLRNKAPKVYELMEQGISGARALRSWSAAGRLIALSMSLWTVDAGLYWAGAYAMRLEPSLNYGRSVLVLSAAAASSFLPAVPGAFGTFEQAIKVFLVHLNYSGTLAFSYAGFIHIVNYLVITTLGIVFLYKAGHTLGSLKSIGSRS